MPERDYRYSLLLTSARFILLDKRGNILEGWDPTLWNQKVGRGSFLLQSSRKGDMMVAFTEDGELYLFNRRGELQTNQGFPHGAGF